MPHGLTKTKARPCVTFVGRNVVPRFHASVELNAPLSKKFVHRTGKLSNLCDFRVGISAGRQGSSLSTSRRRRSINGRTATAGSEKPSVVAHVECADEALTIAGEGRPPTRRPRDLQQPPTWIDRRDGSVPGSCRAHRPTGCCSRFAVRHDRTRRDSAPRGKWIERRSPCDPPVQRLCATSIETVHDSQGPGKHPDGRPVRAGSGGKSCRTAMKERSVRMSSRYRGSRNQTAVACEGGPAGSQT